METRAEEKVEISPILENFKEILNSEIAKIVDEDTAKNITEHLFEKIIFLKPDMDQEIINKQLKEFMTLVDDLTYHLWLKKAIETRPIINKLIAIQQHIFDIKTKGQYSNYVNIDPKTSHLFEALTEVASIKILPAKTIGVTTKEIVDTYIESLKNINITPEKKEEEIEVEFLSDTMRQAIRKTLLDDSMISKVANNIEDAVNIHLKRLNHDTMRTIWYIPETLPEPISDRETLFMLVNAAKSPVEKLPTLKNSATMFGGTTTIEPQIQINENTFGRSF